MIKRIAILLSYILVAVGVLATTIILVAFGQGYNYNLRTNTFSIDGLLVLESVPGGARVTVDGKLLRRKTPYRATMQSGMHDVSLTKDGYRTWNKRVQVLATGVTTWDEILMIPNELNPSQVVSGKNVTKLFATRDRKRFAYITNSTDPGVWVLSADRKQSERVYTPAAATAERPAEVITDASWAEDGSHLLVQTQIGAEANYTVVPSGGGQVINLTQLFRFDLKGLQFSPNDWRELYWISPEGLRKLNVEAKTVSAVLAERVLAYTFAGNDRLAFVQAGPTGKILASSDRSGGNQRRLVEAIAESPSYQITYSLYKSHDYVTVLPAATQTATVYSDVFTSTPSAKVISLTAKSVVTSDDGRFVGFIYNDGFGAYDLDDGLVYTKKTSDVAALGWFDETHIILTRQGHAEIAEYDGGNLVELQVCAGQPFGSNDKRQVLCLGVPANGTADINAVDLKK